MNNISNKQVCDLNKNFLSPSSHKSTWKTVKLPVATTLNLEDKVVDLDKNTVLKLRGGITPELDLLSPKNVNKIQNVKVDFIDPRSDRILFHISRHIKGLDDKFFATPFSNYNVGSNSSKKVPHTMELRQGFGCKNYNFRKLNEQKGKYEVFMRCKNLSVAASICYCLGDPSACGNLIFKFYSMGKHSKKKLLMIRNMYEETIEYESDLSLEEAVFVGYAMDWIICANRVVLGGMM